MIPLRDRATTKAQRCAAAILALDLNQNKISHVRYSEFPNAAPTGGPCPRLLSTSPSAAFLQHIDLRRPTQQPLFRRLNPLLLVRRALAVVLQGLLIFIFLKNHNFFHPCFWVVDCLCNLILQAARLVCLDVSSKRLGDLKDLFAKVFAVCQ